ncbi:MAG: hypothetical protein H3C34_21915 [Caldilineaceae bacterium]|nr:hypothetical protein [Caldilineaceae bacterium]
MLATVFAGDQVSTRAPAIPVAERAGGATTPSAPSALTTALGFTPAGATLLQFTNWSLIKQYESAGQVTSKSSMDARMDFLLSTTRQQAAASMFTGNYLRNQAELWGWDTTDLLWEATIDGIGPPIHVLRLRADFNMAALMRRFEERDFSRSEEGDAVLYSHPLDLRVDWRTDLAVFNAAVLPAQHILIHASSPEAVLAAVRASQGAIPTWAGLPAFTGTASALGETAAAVLAPGPSICAVFDPAMIVGAGDGAPLTATELEALKAERFGDGSLQPFLVFGVGYRSEAGRPLGVIAMRYLDAARAAADLAPRRRLAEEGLSLGANKPYAEVLFTVEDALANGPNLLLYVRPANDQPRRLFEMIYRRDLGFAACE